MTEEGQLGSVGQGGREMEGLTLVLQVCTEATAFLSGGSMGPGRGHPGSDIRPGPNSHLLSSCLSSSRQTAIK